MRLLALLLTVITGATALVYEVAWQRYLATLLGSHSEATSAVLGIFLAGLSTGYWVFGKVSRRLAARAARLHRDPPFLSVYGAVEASIGLYACCFPFLFSGVEVLSLSLPQLSPLVGFATDVVLAALLLVPPTVLMGSTIPLLTQALSRNLAESTRVHAFVYAFNTVGAFFGALGAGYVLIPLFGLHDLMFAMGSINLGAGALFVVLGVRARGGFVPEDAEPEVPPHFTAYLAIAFLVGFAMMVVQTVMNRLGALSFGSSPFTFSMIVALFVLSIALGSFAVSRMRRIPPGLLRVDLMLLAGWLWVLYFGLDLLPYFAHLLRLQFSELNIAFYAYQGGALAMLFLVLGPPIALSGAALPLLFHGLRQEVGDLGHLAGDLYSWNTVGSLVGALLGGYVLLFWLDLHVVFRVAIAAIIASVVVFDWTTDRSRVGASAFAVLAGGLLVLAPPWSVRDMNSGLFRQRKLLAVVPYLPDRVIDAYLGGAPFLFHKDDPIESVAVIGTAPGRGPIYRAILNNGKSDSSTLQDRPTMGLSALLPAVLTERVERAFVIGWGTGITVGELASLDSVDRVVAVEISPGVLEAAPLFDFANLGARTSPKVEIVRSDAYRALLRTRENFDAIVSEPSNPWVAGVEMLFSREFLEAARDRLRPGGVYLQWMQQYETDPASVNLVLRTYQAVFPHVAVWHGTGPDLLILGFPEEPSADLEEVARRFARPDVAAGMHRSGVDDLPSLLAHELLPVGVVRELPLKGPLHTLYHPRLAHRAGIAFFQGHSAALPSPGPGPAAQAAVRGSLLRRAVDRDGAAEVLPDAAAEACRHRADSCLALSAAWLARAPDSEPAQDNARAVELQTLDDQQVGERDVRLLALLVAGGRYTETPISLRDARRTLWLLERVHHPAVDFELHRVLSLFGPDCVAPRSQPDGCRVGLQEARERLGVAAKGGSPSRGGRRSLQAPRP